MLKSTINTNIAVTPELRRKFAEAKAADDADPNALNWADDLPEAPPLDEEFTTALFVTKPEPTT